MAFCNRKKQIIKKTPPKKLMTVDFALSLYIFAILIMLNLSQKSNLYKH